MCSLDKLLEHERKDTEMLKLERRIKIMEFIYGAINTYNSIS